MLIAHRADKIGSSLPPSLVFDEVVDMSNPLHFAAVPRAVSLLSTVGAPMMLPDPDYSATRVLVEAYLVEILGIVVCAYLSMRIRRKHMVQWPLLAAAVL